MMHAWVRNQRGWGTAEWSAPGFALSPLFIQDGVVLGADTRSTAGTTVADKNCEKIHYIADNIKCCGAGTAADTEAVTSMTVGFVLLQCFSAHK